MKQKNTTSKVLFMLVTSAFVIVSIYGMAVSYTVQVGINPTTVRPNGSGSPNSTDATVTVTSGGNPVYDVNVTMSAQAVAYSGGHNHTSGRPVGTFSPSSGKTNQNGQFLTTYTASRFGGTETLKATADSSSGTANLTVQVPSLSALSSSQYYDLIGQTPSHPNNHYGISSANSDLAGIAGEYNATYPYDPVLDYNDQSLVYGGLFDISDDWQTPHNEHHLGINCDLDLNNVPVGNRPTLRYIIEVYYGGSIYDEGGHWHLTVG